MGERADIIIGLSLLTLMTGVCIFGCRDMLDPVLSGEVFRIRSTTVKIYQDHTTRSSNRSGSHVSYVVSYTFMVDGVRYAGRSSLSDPPEPTMPVEYVEGDPNKNGLNLRRGHWLMFCLYVVSVLVFVLCLYIWYRIFKGIWRRRWPTTGDPT